MAFREFRISNYRNVGISKEQSLLLNTSIGNGEMGSLVFVVGPNNSGKSNCLDAMLSMGNEKKITERDLPDFTNQEVVPEISLVVREEGLWVGSKVSFAKKTDEKSSFYQKNGVKKSKCTRKVKLTDESLDFAEKLLSNVPYKLKEVIVKSQETKEFGKKLLVALRNNFGSNVFNTALFPSESNAIYNNIISYDNWQNDHEALFTAAIKLAENKWGTNWISNVDRTYSTLKQNSNLNVILEELKNKERDIKLPLLVASRQLIELIQKSNSTEKDKINISDLLSDKDLTKELTDILKFAENKWGKDFYKTKFEYKFDESKYKEIKKLLTTKEEIVNVPEIDTWEKENNLKTQPNIVLFKETEIVQKSLSITPADLDKSEFFKVLLKAIDYPQTSLSKQFEDVKNGLKVTGTLRTSENLINKKLEKINDQFNRLFFQKDLKYSFRILLETNKIEFSLLIDELPLNLDKQSTGFRWFFNFYFTVIAQKDLGRGDIIIMDEPATNLHVSGITELRDFIKDYAKKTELTFVISTHSPFFIDVDNLDEVRVVSRKNNEAVISDKFQVIEDDDTDALKPIKDALTVGRHILLNPGEKTIFVEGMTDYVYLTTFKLNYPDLNQDVHFLPIQGLKKEKLLDRIMKIEKLPTILVDNDHYGKAIIKEAEGKMYRDKVEVIILSEIDAGFKAIESLFTDKDRPKDKSFETAVSFKNTFNKSEIDEQTVYNFKRLFNNIAS